MSKARGPTGSYKEDLIFTPEYVIILHRVKESKCGSRCSRKAVFTCEVLYSTAVVMSTYWEFSYIP